MILLLFFFFFLLGLIKDVRIFHSSYVGIANALLNFIT